MYDAANDEFSFASPEELNRPLPIALGLSGGSGTGKTYSALLVASGIADGMTGAKNAPIALLDTENGRGLHYRDRFPQILGHYVDFSPLDKKGRVVGYPPERVIALLDMVERSGVRAMVFDSFSHVWEGINGVLELQAAELDRLCNGDETKAERVGQLAWAAIKPRYRKLINRIIRSPVNPILCTRAKPVMQKFINGKEVNARKTKTRRADVPWDVAADGDLMFEMTAMVIFEPKHPGCPKHQIKVADQFKGLLIPDRPLTYETGLAMAEWARGAGDSAANKDLMDKARQVARQGTEAVTEFWKSLSKPARSVLEPIKDELKQTAAEADAMQPEDENPFSGPTQEQLEMAERAALAAARAAAEAAERADDEFGQ